VAKELIWNGEKWVEKREYEERERLKEALKKLLEEVELEIEIDSKTGRGKAKFKMKE
jgi:CRISPR/Cas system CMR subunit Cmr4 (Cas7 group RAMP superfamily)